jgi:hypothetical protein
MGPEQVIDVTRDLDARGRQQDEVVAGALQVGDEMRGEHDGETRVGGAVQQGLHE